MYKYFKRTFDFIIALVALIVLFVPLVIVAIIIKLDSKGLIGPRPALTYHPWPYEQYDEYQRHMFDVLPGVTGWAQVNGRKEVPWPERIELNVWYAQHMSLGLDLKIFFMTIFKVVTNANNENIGETSVKK